jgi:transcription antitermination protein NusB
MPSRQRSRQYALQMLYLLDMREQPVEEAIASFYASLASEEAEPTDDKDPFAEQLVRGTLEQRNKLDQAIAKNSQHWRLDRMAVVDRNLLRLAAYELTYSKTPAAVVIDQALELAGKFCAPESVSFLNGVLDAIRKDLAPAPNSTPKAT